jgi:hypothetical protein
VDVELRLRKATDEAPGRPGMIEVDVGHQDLGDLLRSHLGLLQTL